MSGSPSTDDKDFRPGTGGRREGRPHRRPLPDEVLVRIEEEVSEDEGLCGASGPFGDERPLDPSWKEESETLEGCIDVPSLGLSGLELRATSVVEGPGVG